MLANLKFSMIKYDKNPDLILPFKSDVAKALESLNILTE